MKRNLYPEHIKEHNTPHSMKDNSDLGYRGEILGYLWGFFAVWQFITVTLDLVGSSEKPWLIYNLHFTN